MHTLINTTIPDKQIIIDFEDRLPHVSDLKCGYLLLRWIEDDHNLDAMYRTELLTVVMKLLFGVKDAYPILT